ncbi:hypothetical protein KRR40_31245 [Niabella defluvii]|nr:hypothetical protein KRR40_31245 [Niabella sp. I65]
MKRSNFIKMGAMAVLGPLLVKPVLGTTPVSIDSDLFQRLIRANDNQVAQLIKLVEKDKLRFSRMVAYDIATLTAAYCVKESAYYHQPVLIEKLNILVEFLAAAQSADGTVNVGNLESPPDTAFLIEILGPAASIMRNDNSSHLQQAQQQLKQIMLKAGEGLVTGGVHTPNHRWVISAALAQINHLYPDKKYIERIDDWLGEGVFTDADGHYPERSGIYSGVENAALITIARLTGKTWLYKPVRKNLAMYTYYIEANGDLVCNDSRRQDQYEFAAKPATIFYLSYRYMAIHDQDRNFAAMAKMLEATAYFEKDVLSRSLFYFMEDVTLQQPLPAAAALPNRYEKLFPTSHLLRIKDGHASATLFGGVDWPLTIASGRSNSPDFFSYRKGNAILKYMRLSSSFFSMGYFYSDGLQKDGNSYVLRKKQEVPYYQPLPKEKRKADGDYVLSPSIDGRFWNKMDFSSRPVSNVKILETIIRLTENKGTVQLEYDIKGMKGVPVTIELCFKEGGQLTGVTDADASGNSFLEQGTGAYRYGSDFIKFGPGAVSHKQVMNLEGERYSTHFGTLRTQGAHVYITGVTPFKHILVFS